jgi:hypothetical protein
MTTDGSFRARTHHCLLALVRVNYAAALAELGDHAQGIAEIELAIAKQASGPILYNGACAYCHCSAAVDRDIKLSAAERDKLAAKYLDRAIELLHEAEKKAFFKQAIGVSDLQTDHDLDPLRHREEFKQLLGRVQEVGGEGGRK